MQEQNTPAASTVSPKQVKINRMKLLVLLAIPISMLGLAYFVYFTGIGMPEGTSNKGVLINPPIQLNELAAEGEGSLLPKDNALWSFAVIGDEQCLDSCAERLYLTRQIKTSLHKYSEKMQRLYLNVSGKPLSDQLAALIEKEHPGLIVKSIDKHRLDTLLASQAAAQASDPNADFYFVDRQGFSMLYYTPKHTYKDAIKDVKFLLKHAPDEQ